MRFLLPVAKICQASQHRFASFRASGLPMIAAGRHFAARPPPYISSEAVPLILLCRRFAALPPISPPFHFPISFAAAGRASNISRHCHFSPAQRFHCRRRFAVYSRIAPRLLSVALPSSGERVRIDSATAEWWRRRQEHHALPPAAASSAAAAARERFAISSAHEAAVTSRITAPEHHSRIDRNPGLHEVPSFYTSPQQRGRYSYRIAVDQVE